MSDVGALLEQALRIVHVLAGVAWLGEVLVVALVLSPVIRRLEGPDRTNLLAVVFPLVFRLATILGGVAVVSGAGLLWLLSGFRAQVLLGTAWGTLLLPAAFLGLGLYVFHLVMERRLLRLTERLRRGDGGADDASDLARHLAVIPPVGAALLGAAAVLMIYASHYV